MDFMEDEKREKKGNGIFLGIVGVATLIVAIIGASFAYFSIQASSAEGAVNLTAYEFTASLSMAQVYGPGEKGIIPVLPNGSVTNAAPPDNTNLAYAINVKKSCLDDNSYGVCALYSVNIVNNSPAEKTFNGTIITNNNIASENRSDATAFENLQYREVTGELVSGSNNELTISNTAVDINPAVNGVTNTGTSVVVPANSNKTIYFIIYLNEKTGPVEGNQSETETKDQSNEMGATFQGQVVFSENGSNNKLTGTFTVS